MGVKYRTCVEAKDMYCVVKLDSFLYKDIGTGILIYILYIYFILLKVFLASTMETLDNCTISKVTI